MTTQRSARRARKHQVDGRGGREVVTLDVSGRSGLAGTLDEVAADPTGSRRCSPDRRYDATRPKVVLVEDRREAQPGAVTISVVPDLSNVLDARSKRLHGDVLDALVDLVVELLDEETGHGEGQDR